MSAQSSRGFVSPHEQSVYVKLAAPRRRLNKAALPAPPRPLLSSIGGCQQISCGAGPRAKTATRAALHVVPPPLTPVTRGKGARGILLDFHCRVLLLSTLFAIAR